ncbi:hypothetical protein niasHT_019906 [Heterodera trifolii]|uniref:Origin recognition complex subunit 2 n=1 Tax=Heterodera trifolii TaxID=157864 RepID=A0ABD2L3R6_9BILA
MSHRAMPSSLNSNKKRNANYQGTSSVKEIDESLIETTPPKTPKIDGNGSAGQTPSPSRPHYQMNALEAALSHYFSPKKRSPGRPAQRKVQFDDTSHSEGSDGEEVEEDPKSEKWAKCDANRSDFAAVKCCFEKLDNHLPWKFKRNPNGETFGRHFLQWFHFLESGQFSILLHGLGSKRRILEDFRDFLSLRNRRSFVGDGLNPSDTMPKMIDRMTEELKLKGMAKTKEKSVEAAAKALRNAVDAQLRSPIVFILLNIDSPQLRSREHQKALSVLAKSSKVQLIASVDHVNAALIWDQSLRDAFAWLHFPISTFHCYWAEVMASGTELLGLDDKGIAKHTLSSLDAFWGATTSNMRKILAQLTLHAPSREDRGRMDALGIPKFCRILRDEFATTSETVLRQQLIEFCDHRIIQLDKNSHIHLLVDRQLLNTFLDAKIGNE